MKKTIKLTESQLHQLVKESVQQILMEDMEDEAFGGFKALGSLFGNRAKDAGQGMANYASQKYNQAKNAVGRAATAVGNKVNQAGQYVGNKVNQAGQAVGNAYNTAKQTYQTGSASDDAQSAIENAVKALNNLKAADRKLQSLGQYSVIGRQGRLIDQLISSLGSMNGRFKARTSAFTH
jgi:hypothetical protein